MPVATSGMIDPEGPWKHNTYPTVLRPAGQAKTVSPLLRPIKSPSQKNQESISQQEARDRGAAERRGRIFWRAESQFHHNGELASQEVRPQTGRALGENNPLVHGSYNPIRREWEVLPPEGTPLDREQPLPGSNRESLKKPTAYGPPTTGQYDCILHQWVVQPDAETHKQRQKQVAREKGVRSLHIDGCRPTSAAWQGTYDPIRCEWVQAPLGSMDANASLRSQQEADKRLSGRGMVHLRSVHGEYDPIRGTWSVPPSDAEEHEQALRLKLHGDVPSKRVVPRSPNVGVYNPILNQWIEPPKNGRIIQGLTLLTRLTADVRVLFGL
ncbi:hypothetical protein WJX72_001827 [[Myrmecia] bisecta]|uniref:Uncharacterized protein n=1 Tax=[Myrmecia] bisecta TaxID=41462 RepID=A0AAW1Q893_9CHLO